MQSGMVRGRLWVAGLAVVVAAGAVVLGAACGGGSSNVVQMPEGGSGSSSASNSGSSSTGSGSFSGSASGVGTGAASGSPSSGSGATSGSGASSGSPSSGTASGDGGGSGSSGDGGGEGGAGQVTTWGTQVTFPVGWPATTAGNQGTGNIVIMFLAVQTLQSDGKTYTATTRSCRSTLPPLQLNGLAAALVGGSQVTIQIPDSTFDAISRTFQVTGTQGPPGGMVTQQDSLGGLGLVNGPYLMLPSPTAWPADCAMGGSTCNSVGSFMASDLQDDDMDSNPGITAVPSTMMPNVQPPTSLGVQGQTNSADKVYIVLRQQISISGTRSADGKSAKGTATLSLFDNHVVGCHSIGPNGNGNCTSDEASFVDTNRTKYTDQASSTSSTPNPISPTNQVMGTFTQVQLNNTATCNDVRNATYP